MRVLQLHSDCSHIFDNVKGVRQKIANIADGEPIERLQHDCFSNALMNQNQRRVFIKSQKPLIRQA